MHIRIFQSIILAIFFAFAPPLAAARVAEGDRAAFIAAYMAYEEAVAAKDVDAVAVAAEKVLNIALLIYPDDRARLAEWYVKSGSAFLKIKNYSRAARFLQEGIDRIEREYGSRSKRLIAPMNMIAQAEELGFRNFRYVARLQEEIFSLTHQHYGNDSLEYADASMLLGQALYFLNDGSYLSARSAKYFRIAFEKYGRLFDQPDVRTGLAAFWRGKSADKRGSRSSAEKRYLEALEIFEQASADGSDEELMAHTYLIKLYEDRGRSDEATLHCQAISRLRPLAGVDGAKPLYRKQLVYPRSAQLAKRSGYVVMNFTVTTLGTVTNVSVLESGGGKKGEFERAALDAVSDYRFAPAVKDGELIETPDVRNLFTFKFED